MTGYDKSVADFRRLTKPGVDLALPEHRYHLLHWLNRWGCRHLATDHHDLASASLAGWYQANQSRLPGLDARLGSLEDSQLEQFVALFDSLKNLDAARKTRGGQSHTVSLGPTAAAKTLFALRPHVFVAWDDAIRSNLGHDGSGASYVRLLADVRGKLRTIANQCATLDIPLDALPKTVGRPQSTAAELINEYYWVTLTRKVIPPEPARIRRWLDWSN
jgi:hypothetical protein